MSVQKAIPLGEYFSTALRIEAFNLFNHAQFFGPEAVNGNITNAAEFGHVVSAQSPRLMQLSLKLRSDSPEACLRTMDHCIACPHAARFHAISGLLVTFRA